MKITILSVNNTANEEQELQYDEDLLINNKVILSDNFYSAEKEYKLIIKPEAVNEIFDFIEWDIGTRDDIRVEQSGILLGKRFYDPLKNIHFTVVSKAITADKAEGTSAFIEITPACWSDMHDKKDRYIEVSGDQVVIIGWFHTHPNMLPVFMSGIDRNTQNMFFSGNNTYSVVINPQRHLIKVFRAAECFATQAFFMLNERDNTEV